MPEKIEDGGPALQTHTPTPWRTLRNEYYWEIVSDVHGALGDVCASKHIYIAGKPLPADEAEAIAAANAALIVRAVNRDHLFDELVEKLAEAQRALAMLTAPDAIRSSSVQHAWAQAVAAECNARSALSKAEAGRAS